MDAVGERPIGEPSRRLRVRWLGRVPYAEAADLQHALFEHGRDDWLLLLEHPHVYTLGARADLANVLVDPGSVGVELVRADRGGDVTYHGPGQLVGYPILSLPGKGGGDRPDTVAHVRAVEQLVIDTLAELGLANAGRLPQHPGVWIDPESDRPRKIAAIGVRLARGRSMHGFALNVAPEMAMFDHIVPCGIADKGVTSIAQEGIEVSMREVVDLVVARAVDRWAGPGAEGWERSDVVWRTREGDEDLAPFSRGLGAGAPVRRAADHGAAAGGVGGSGVAVEGPSLRLRGRLAAAGVAGGLAVDERKPEWLRARVDLGDGALAIRRTLRDLSLVTVCEEAGCPNLSECWADGTATFMINGERCTRACGFCLVDTRRPEPLDVDEPARVAEAVERLGLSYAVVTTVARDDLDDDGAGAMAATVHAIRDRVPGAQIEVLISDCRGRAESLDRIFAARPDVLNHNVETVPRLQRAVRPSAGYARSLAVLGRARAAGLVTKSGLVVGMGETDDEILATLADLAGIGVSIVTIGQYLRPTSHHLPVERWVTPAQFEQYRLAGEAMGIDHVESSPLTRSSYHAKRAAHAADAGERDR
ncbi:MAG: lipoyl synthase [Acidobacteria bacterium]|nr:lipoyl synthase [Acidobacteriota bacterium]